MSRNSDDSYGTARDIVLPNRPIKCDECGGTVVQTYADWVCEDCGLVHDQIMVSNVNGSSEED